MSEEIEKNMLKNFVKSLSFRKYAKGLWTTIPLREAFEYLGYEIYVGRK